MNNMPLSIALAFAVLIGWPAIKVAATILARSQWKRLHALETSLLSDPAYISTDDRSVIANEITDARGQALFLLMPAVVLFGGIAFAIAEICGQSDILNDENEAKELFERQYIAMRGSHLLIRDERFHELVDTSFNIVALHYPVCSILTLFALTLVSPLIFVAGGLKSSVRIIGVRVLKSSAFATFVFGRGIGVHRA
jgi:hypothetical protein